MADAFRENAAAYQDSIDDGGKPGAGRLALMRQVYLAPTDEQAWEEMATDLIRLNAVGAAMPPEISPAEQAKATEAVHQLIEDEIFIAGSPQTVIAQIERFQETIGFNVFLANPYAAAVDDARIERCLRLLATEVMPALDLISAQRA